MLVHPFFSAPTTAEEVRSFIGRMSTLEDSASDSEEGALTDDEGSGIESDEGVSTDDESEGGAYDGFGR
jgi:hypothetical protein